MVGVWSMCRTILIVVISVVSYLFQQTSYAYPSTLQALKTAHFSIADEEKLGKQFSIFVKGALPIIYDPYVVEYIRKIVERIVASLPPTYHKFTVYVIDDPAVNAFATPGGYIFVHTGLINALETEDQLAGVLSHELAHITNRHIAKRIERSQKITIASVLAGLAGLALGPAGIAVLLGSLGLGQNANLYFSRVDETEADNAGIQYLTLAGYNPYGLSESFTILRKQLVHQGVTEVPVYLTTHPALQERIQTTALQAKSFSEDIQNRSVQSKTFKEIQHFVRAKYIDPEQAKALLERSQNFTKLLHTQKKALRSTADPVLCTVLRDSAIIESRMHARALAEERFNDARTCNPADAITLRESGIFFFDEHVFEKAELFLSQSYIINDTDYLTAFYLARTLEERGKAKQTLSLYEKIIAQFPDEPNVRFFYARSLQKVNEDFLSTLQLAYAHLYANNLSSARFFMNNAEKLIRNAQQKELFAIYTAAYKERKEYIEK